MRTPDILIVGGGIIGLTAAYALAKAGRAVEVVDRGDLGQAASWAGAGILPPGNPDRAATPIERLRAASVSQFAKFSAELRDLTGIDNGYLKCQGIEFLAPEDAYAVDLWKNEGIRFHSWFRNEMTSVVPPAGTAGYFFPDLAQVRNPWHLRALIAACESVGVQLSPNTEVANWETTAGKVTAARTQNGEAKPAGQFVIATGAWADGLLKPLGWEPGVHPVRGQIVLIQPPKPVVKTVVMVGKRYLVPRADGRVLVGSTEEPEAGFTNGNTVEGVQNLIEFTHALVPRLIDAPVEKTWSGLRPGTPDGLPFLGPVPGWDNVVVAVGHFRSGVQLSIGTGDVVCDLLHGTAPRIPIDAFRLDRTPEMTARPAFRS